MATNKSPTPPATTSRLTDIGAVVIGRNEGARLDACLRSLNHASHIIYVDSGSDDNSVEIAENAGASVVQLDKDIPFTAARARNAGFEKLSEFAGIEYVQFVDGDCVVRDGWLQAARSFLETTPKAAVVCGRRRERHPEASVYNRLCDDEWNTPTGLAKACGGDAMMRVVTVRDVGGYRDDLIAGEEPELCVRVRQAGWQVWRIDQEMTWHDAALSRFTQWFRRSRRTGHAFAQGASIHGTPPERHWVKETRRALFWGIALPLAAFIAGAFNPLGYALFLAFPMQVIRLAIRKDVLRRSSWEIALFNVMAKFPEALGVIEFYTHKLRGGRSKLIEYK